MTHKTQDHTLDAIIRVNHAGEYGAKRIYDGQLAVLRGKASYDTVAHMKEQEREHLETFEALIRSRAVRPTALMPLWHIGGWALGAATAALGEKAAMACTVAVESVIEEHYATQEKALQDNEQETPLRETISRFRADEMEHHDTALDQGAQQTQGYGLLYHGIRAITKTAIALSQKI